jgi:hypothetical protein
MQASRKPYVELALHYSDLVSTLMYKNLYLVAPSVGLMEIQTSRNPLTLTRLPFASSCHILVPMGQKVSTGVNPFGSGTPFIP